MSYFYGKVDNGIHNDATRRGFKSRGLTGVVASHKGRIETHVWHDPNSNTDRFRVTIGPWQGYGPPEQVIAEGVL